MGPVMRIERTGEIGIAGGIGLGALLLALGCGPTGSRPVTLGSPAGAFSALPTFTDVTEASGVRFRHTHGGGQRLKNILESLASSTAVCDLSGDGRLDLFLTNGSKVDEHGALIGGAQHPRSAYYRAEPDGTYSDRTEASGLAGDGYGMGAYCADYDNDGDTDLFVTRYGTDALYRNNGDGTFTDVAAEAGVADPRWSTGAAFGDIDKDGDLDLYVCHYLEFRPDMVGVHASTLSKHEGFYFFPGPRDYEAVTDSLYRNDGNGHFTDITQQAGLLPGGKGLGVVFSDFDGDGNEDIYVTNDKTPKFLYWNRGDGTFTEGAMLAGVAVSEDGEETGGMGIGVDDVDNDGRPDMFITNMIFEYNSLYRNRGDRVFTDITARAHLAEDSYRFVGFGTGFFDYDNDGFLDVVVLNGHVVDYIEAFSTSMTFQQEPQMYRNERDGTFHNVSRESGAFFDRRYAGRSVAFGDLDEDGDIDLLVGTNNGPAYLLRNDGGNRNGWLRVDVQGTHCNRDGFGAVVTVRDGTFVRTHEVRAQYGFMASNDPRVHFGLGARTELAMVEVRWPCGKVESLEHVPVNRVLRATEGRGIEVVIPPGATAQARLP
jgi:enediyne biosynthesis protein E4